MCPDDGLIRDKDGITIDETYDQKMIDKWVAEHTKKPVVVTKGGSGSGHHGHAGRPGKQGGSLPGTGSVGSMNTQLARVRFGHLYKKENIEYVSAQAEQGAFRSDRGHIRNDGDVILKYRETIWGFTSDYNSEVEAYEAAERMGFKGLVPRTEKTKNPVTGDTCSAQKLVDGKTISRSKDFPGLEVDKFSQMAVLDVITGNRDRHGSNVFVDQKNGRIYAIDNGFAFMEYGGGHKRGVEAAREHYYNITRHHGSFRVLAKHIAAGDRLVNNASWRKRIRKKFHALNKDVLKDVDYRWKEFKSNAKQIGWWTDADDLKLQQEYSSTRSSPHGIWNQ